LLGIGAHVEHDRGTDRALARDSDLDQERRAFVPIDHILGKRDRRARALDLP
jgi:hypothetical protein